MEEKYIESLIQATANVIETMALVKVVAGKPYKKQDESSYGAVSGMIGMAGSNVHGNLVVSFQEPTILKIVNNMLCENYSQLGNEVVDAVGEITNMICGGAKNNLSQHGVNIGMASPVTLVGQAQINRSKKTPVYVIPFSTEAGDFVVEAQLETLAE